MSVVDIAFRMANVIVDKEFRMVQELFVLGIHYNVTFVSQKINSLLVPSPHMTIEANRCRRSHYKYAIW
jgi:predicted ATP-grasp superfamily ATP-dependent carboligase